MLQILVGLNVIDEEGYRQYRDNMKPILNEMGGGFRYDLAVSEVVELDIAELYKSELEASINRVFIIYFPDNATREHFFSDTHYLEIKKQYFEPAVALTSILAEWEE